MTNSNVRFQRGDQMAEDLSRILKPSSAAVSPLRERMVGDMRMRKLELKTRTAYIRGITELAAFLKRSRDMATVEDLRRFQLCVVDPCREFRCVARCATTITTGSNNSGIR